MQVLDPTQLKCYNMLPGNCNADQPSPTRYFPDALGHNSHHPPTSALLAWTDESPTTSGRATRLGNIGIDCPVDITWSQSS